MRLLRSQSVLSGLALLVLALLLLDRGTAYTAGPGTGQDRAEPKPADVVETGRPNTDSSKGVRVAVIDIAAVFSSYEKTRVEQSTLHERVQDAQRRISALRDRYVTVTQELENLEADSDERRAKSKTLDEIRASLRSVQKDEVDTIRAEQARLANLIRDEISAEVSAMASEIDVDIVFERMTLIENAETKTNARWPVVHFARPELDWTERLTARLNARYAAR